MKLKSYKYEMPADKNSLETIQKEMSRYADEFKDVSTIKDAEKILSRYVSISFDEGYRSVIENIKEEVSYRDIEVKPRIKGFFEYVEEEDIKNLIPFLKRRINSKRLRKYRTKMCIKEGIEDSVESFILSTSIHTAFEAGYLKASSIEETANIICNNKENADIVIGMINSINKDEL